MWCNKFISTHNLKGLKLQPPSPLWTYYHERESSTGNDKTGLKQAPYTSRPKARPSPCVVALPVVVVVVVVVSFLSCKVQGCTVLHIIIRYRSMYVWNIRKTGEYTRGQIIVLGIHSMVVNGGLDIPQPIIYFPALIRPHQQHLSFVVA